jgi:predicted transcriptional regulator
MNTTLNQFIETVACQKAPGPSTMFTAAHVFFALELMAERPIGRNKMAKKLEVGEGTVRTIINRLKNSGLIVTSKEGCNLTSKGFAVWKRFEELFPKRVEIGETELTTAEHNYAFLVKNSGHKVKSGIEQRDAAIVAGAKRAVIMVSKGGHLTIESVSNSLEQQFPTATDQILTTIHPEDNDVIVLVGAETIWKAKHGAFAASWALVKPGEKTSPA